MKGYTQSKVLMDTYYFITLANLFAQAYGSDAYGTSDYNGQTTTTTEQAPNTGFFGQPQDVVVGSITGILLVAIAVVGIVYVLISRARRKKSED